MSRMFVLAIVLAMGLGSLCMAIEPSMGYGFGEELWSAPHPSGMRFSGPPTSVRTAGVENYGSLGGYGNYGGNGIGTIDYGDLWGGSCGSCGVGICVHWKYLPWTASWGGHGEGCGGGHGCRKCNTCR